MTYLSGIQEFIASWDDRFVEASDRDIVRESPQGNINTEGTSACCDSPTFTKYHRKFKKSLEPGVRDLAIALILKFDCITYSSCQGHPSTVDADFRQRYVAILPRNETEYRRLYSIFDSMAKLTNSLLPDNPVRVVLGEDRLESEVLAMPGLTLFFVAATADEELYFREIEVVYNKVLELIGDRA